MKKHLIAFLILLGLLLSYGIFVFKNKNAPASTLSQAVKNTVSIKNTVIEVEIAKTPQEQERGLSYRRGLSENAGMLFDFTDSAYKRPVFWMKDMHFNLDLLWIAHNTVIAINSDVPAPTSTDTTLPTYTPPSDIDYVLEVNAGFAKKHSILIGDSVIVR